MSKRKRSQTGLVYSTEVGRMCPRCRNAINACTCKQKNTSPDGDGIARIRREVKGRRGKTVTTIAGLSLKPDDLKELAADLKRKCGCGGSVKDGVIEIQGDHRDVLFEALKQKGFSAKKAGG